MLMRRMIAYARHRGIGELFGEVPSANRPMLELCEACGCLLRPHPEDPGVMIVALPL